MVTGLKRGSWPTRTPQNQYTAPSPTPECESEITLWQRNLNKPGSLFGYPLVIRRHKR